MRGSRYEISTTGYDLNLSMIGGDLSCLPYNVGLVIPPNVAPVPAGFAPCKARYTFLLARASFRTGQKARLVGLRQFLAIGDSVANGGGEGACVYPLEMTVTSPTWRFVDGQVAWHLRRIPQKPPQFSTAIPQVLTFGGQDSQTPALLGTAATAGVGESVASYTPIPTIPGESLIADLDTFYGLRFPWGSSQSYFSLDYEIEGPCDIALYATVKQTDPETRCTLLLPDPVPGVSNFLPPEEAFLQAFPAAVYRRIAGSLIFEERGLHPC